MAIVLLVDESQTIRRVVDMALKGSGHNIISVADGGECRQAIFQYSPGVALINYILPDMSGINLCREIKSNPSTAHLPIIVLGGSYAPFDENEAFGGGADLVLVKPFMTEDLVEAVTKLLSAPAPRRRPEAPVAQPAGYGAEAAPAVAQPGPYSPTPPPRMVPPLERQAYSGQYRTVPEPEPPPPIQNFNLPAAPSQVSSPSISRQSTSPFGRGPAAREVSSRQRAPFQPAPRYTSTPQAVPPPPRPPSGRFPRGFQQPTPQPVPPPTRRTSGAFPPVQVPPQQPPAALKQPEAAPPPAIEAQIDPQELRALLREVLPSIVRDALRQLFRDGLELRLRNYVQERVDQFIREEVRQLAYQCVQEEILRHRRGG